MYKLIGSPKSRAFRVMWMLEELGEAYDKGDTVGCVDAIMDMIYFAIGGLVRSGLSVEQSIESFKAVHAVNMQKKIGVKKGREQHSNVVDAIKSSDVIPAEKAITEILWGVSTNG
jgi:predicted HAD superfamily Cof-like phosphohydrolase